MIKILEIDGPLIVVGDIHGGSKAAGCPPGLVGISGNPLKPNPAQRLINRYWRAFHSKWIPDTIGTKAARGGFTAIINGDAVENQHHGTWELMGHDPRDHINIAAAILGPLRDRCKAMYLTRGSHAHSGEQGNLEDAVAGKLDADATAFDWFANEAAWHLTVKMGDHLISIAHHIGVTSSAAYELSALNREMSIHLNEAGAWGEGLVPLLSMMIRSHRHRACGGWLPTRKGKLEGIILPGWQFHTAYLRHKSIIRLPQYGGIAIWPDRWGLQHRIAVWPHTDLTPKQAGLSPATGPPT